jgi:hypothetical protein
MQHAAACISHEFSMQITELYHDSHMFHRDSSTIIEIHHNITHKVGRTMIHTSYIHTQHHNTMLQHIQLHYITPCGYYFGFVTSFTLPLAGIKPELGSSL